MYYASGIIVVIIKRNQLLVENKKYSAVSDVQILMFPDRFIKITRFMCHTRSLRAFWC